MKGKVLVDVMKYEGKGFDVMGRILIQELVLEQKMAQIVMRRGCWI